MQNRLVCGLVVLSLATGMLAIADTTGADEGDPLTCSGLKRVKLDDALESALPAGDQGFIDSPEEGAWGVFVYDIPIASGVPQSSSAVGSAAEQDSGVWYTMFGEAKKAKECEEYVETLAPLGDIAKKLHAAHDDVQEQDMALLLTTLMEQAVRDAIPDKGG